MAPSRPFWSPAIFHLVEQSVFRTVDKRSPTVFLFWGAGNSLILLVCFSRNVRHVRAMYYTNDCSVLMLAQMIVKDNLTTDVDRVLLCIFFGVRRTTHCCGNTHWCLYCVISLMVSARFRKLGFFERLTPWVHLTIDTRHALVLLKCKMTSLSRHSNWGNI